MNDTLSTLRWTTGTLLLTCALAIGAWGLLSGDALADREHDEHPEQDDHERSPFGPALASPERTLYLEECGSCHLAYPAQFLPSASWRAILSQLEDHFGENAELGGEDRGLLEQWLVRYSADHSGYQGKRYGGGDAVLPLRITERPFFTREHRELPDRLVIGNPGVQSFSRCEACHQGAQEGDFDEGSIHIPGLGRWDD